MCQCSCIFITKNTCKKYYNIYISWIFPLNYVTPKTASFKYSNTLYLDNLPVTQAEPCTEIRCKYKFRVPDFSNTLSDSMVNEILLRTSLKQPGHSTTEPALDNESRHQWIICFASRVTALCNFVSKSATADVIFPSS